MTSDLFAAEFAAAEAALVAERADKDRIQDHARQARRETRRAKSEADLAFVCESSANINTNPRAEQTAIHLDRGLADFYRQFFDGVKSYNRDFDDFTPWSPQA